LAERLAILKDRIWQRRALRRLNAIADRARDTDLASLHVVRSRARELRRSLDRVLQVAEGRLALPLPGSNNLDSPLHSDWAHRPELWRVPIDKRGYASAPNNTRIGTEATLFHNCPLRELTVRQIRNTREEDLAPFGICLDVFRFDGTFLSLALDLPAEAIAGLKKRHLVRLAAVVECEQPLEIFARLNVRHGPNTAQIVRELPLNDMHIAVDFDLAYSNLSEKRVESAWIDLIFEAPSMNLVRIRDVTLSRRPRSEV